MHNINNNPLAKKALLLKEIGGNTADTELAQGAVHTLDRLVSGRRPRRDLFQKRIVIAGDDRARIGGAAVQPDAKTGCTAASGRKPPLAHSRHAVKNSALSAMAISARSLAC